jgi:hypothetical protein
MIELRMNISINDGEFIKSYDKTIQIEVIKINYEIDYLSIQLTPF